MLVVLGDVLESWESWESAMTAVRSQAVVTETGHGGVNKWSEKCWGVGLWLVVEASTLFSLLICGFESLDREGDVWL